MIDAKMRLETIVGLAPLRVHDAGVVDQKPKLFTGFEVLRREGANTLEIGEIQLHQAE